ncbi:MAG: hypothetical protein WBQ19_08035 [Terriglobales bacterium]|jgi:hypothetical protein
MAANPLPSPRTEVATFSVNAATVTSIGPAASHDTIDWNAPSGGGNIAIAVSAVNGVFPLDVNSFTITAGLKHPSTVEPNVPAGDYPFSRNGVAGIGKIIVGQGAPMRAK